ncbi:MAG: TetR/AcrR family transcriptional regulator [bacterium]
MTQTKQPKSHAWWHFWHSDCCHPTDQAQTRTILLEAAFQEVHRVGFQAASLQNILKQTKLTKGALYHHFPNKQALGYAIVDEMLHGFVTQYWIEPLTQTTDPITTLKQSIMDAGQRMTEDDIQLGCPLNNLTQEMAMVDEGFRQRLERIHTDWRNAISDALKRGQAQQQVTTKINPEQFAIVFIATLEGCIGLAKSAQSMELLMACGKGLIDLLDTLHNEETTN